MLSLIKVKFKKIEYSTPISFITFSNDKQDFTISLKENDLLRLNAIIDKLKKAVNDFYITYHSDMNNIPFIIFDNKIHNFSEDSIYSLKNIDSNHFVKSLSFSCLFMLASLIITIPLTLLFTSLHFLNPYFWEILIGWEIFLGGFCFYSLKRYFAHYSFIKKSLSKTMNILKHNKIDYLECDF